VEVKMKEASLFFNNRTQSMRIPKEDNFSGKKVYFEKVGDIGIIIDESKEWAALELLKLLNKEYLNFTRPEDDFDESVHTKAKAKKVKF
jgi:virulence-associated protein VagC